MAAASNYLENKILDHTLRNTPYTQPSALYLALFTGTALTTLANLEAGTLTNEVPTSSNYIRKSIAFSGASGGAALSSLTATFDAATVSWGTVTCVAIMDAVSAGNVLYFGQLTTAKTIDIGDTFQMSAPNLSVSLD